MEMIQTRNNGQAAIGMEKKYHGECEMNFGDNQIGE